MRQIKNVSEQLSLGDYAWFTNGESQILAFRYSEDYWAFYGEDGCGFCGSDSPRYNSVISEFPFLRRFIHSWILLGNTTLEDGIHDLQVGGDGSFNLRYRIMITDIPIDATPCSDDSSVTTDDEDERTQSELPSSFVLKGYETTCMYRGLHPYHHHHDSRLNQPTKSWKGHRIGIELEVEFDSSESRRVFDDIPSNWFYRETDSSLGRNGCEIITIPLLPNDAKDESVWSQLTDAIKSNAESWSTGRCGLHVHIGREILGKNSEEQSESLGKILYFYHHYLQNTSMNIAIFGRERGYHEMCGRTELSSAAMLLGKDVLRVKEIKDRIKNDLIRQNSRDRYFDINIRNPHTIEFRKGRGSINPTRIATVVQYCERICLYAKSTPWIQLSYEDFVAYLKAVLPESNLLTRVTRFNP